MVAVILLDVDGVLVHDRGYRAGIVATVDYFAGMLGLRDMAPTQDDVDALHAVGFTNEWDLNPFAVGILRLKVEGEARVQRPDYQAWGERTRGRPGRPSQRALAVLQEELVRLGLPSDKESELETELQVLLVDTHDIQRCPTTQVHQEFVLGSILYASHYGLQPRFSSPSLLEQEDKPALSPEGNACLERLVTDQGARVCIYTARPSGPPAGARGGEDRFPLAPEAELAVRLVGLERYPLVAMGRMQWLADQHGDKVEALTKPSPVQVLAALGAAISGEEEPALEAAYDLWKYDRIQQPLAGLLGSGSAADLRLFVLEDAVPGLKAAQDGIRLLASKDIAAGLFGIGVTRSPVKADALAPYCRTTVAEVNDGLAWIELHLASAQSEGSGKERHDED